MCRVFSAESGPNRTGQRPPACGRVYMGGLDWTMSLCGARWMGRWTEKGPYVAGVRRPAEVLLVLELGAERAREALEPELGRLEFSGLKLDGIGGPCQSLVYYCSRCTHVITQRTFRRRRPVSPARPPAPPAAPSSSLRFLFIIH